MDSDDDYLYDATDSGNESPEGGEDEEDHVRTFFQILLHLPVKTPEIVSVFIHQRLYRK
jgi:hypothetical protein